MQGPSHSIKAESMHNHSWAALTPDMAAILHFDHVSPDQYPAYARKHDATLSFPEKVSEKSLIVFCSGIIPLLTHVHFLKFYIINHQLMMMLMHIEYMCISAGRNVEDEAIHWTKSGEAFIVRDEKRLSAVWLRTFFGNTKYSSFTRKMYRWGFHKISPSVYHFDRNEVTIFGSINFHRDKKHLLLHMESQTAAKQRRFLISQERNQKYEKLVTTKETKTLSENKPPVIEHLQEKVCRTTDIVLPNSHRSTLDICADTMVSLQRGMCFASTRRENSDHRHADHFAAHARTQSKLNLFLQANPAPLPNCLSPSFNLFEERIKQLVQREHIQMQTLASIISNRSCQK